MGSILIMRTSSKSQKIKTPTMGKTYTAIAMLTSHAKPIEIKSFQYICVCIYNEKEQKRLIIFNKTIKAVTLF